MNSLVTLKDYRSLDFDDLFLLKCAREGKTLTETGRLLLISPAAIHYRKCKIERVLGMRVFVREFQFTRSGRRLAAVVDDLLDKLAEKDSLLRVSAEDGESDLTVNQVPLAE